MNKKELTPAIATHPGELIKDELRERKMTQKQLSEETGIKESVLSETINAKRPVSIKVATALEKGLWHFRGFLDELAKPVQYRHGEHSG